MTFKETAISDLDDVFFDTDEFSDEATYNGEEIDIIEIVAEEQPTGVPGYVLPTKEIHVKKSDVSQPKAGDVVVIDSVSYRVGAGSRMDGPGLWIVPLGKTVGTNA